MVVDKSRFALFFGNRGFFPASLMSAARQEYADALKRLGHGCLMLDAESTRFGAVETIEEAHTYAAFLREQWGKYDGILLVLPNFGDENGAAAALQDAGVPILILAYPDELGKMQPENRRDAFCGKLSIMDVFCQNQIPFTALTPHAVAPGDARFDQNIDYFDRMCRVVKGLRRTRVGAIGARTTAFKTVRIDELTLQKRGVTVETLDLSTVIGRVGDANARRVKEKRELLTSKADFTAVPMQAQDTIARLAAVLDEIVEEYGLDAIALRCWLELQEQLGISPCAVVGEMNDRAVAASCEVDIGSAVAMRALTLATGRPPACLDWNNNYGEDDDKCILFHCGPVPMSLMEGKGRITDHTILKTVLGEGRGYGCNVGRIAPTPFTFANLATVDGAARFYLGEGDFTSDAVPDAFFGCAGVAQVSRLQDVLLHVGREGHRHHVAVSPGRVTAPLYEALTRYLGYDVTRPQQTADGALA